MQSTSVGDNRYECCETFASQFYMWVTHHINRLQVESSHFESLYLIRIHIYMHKVHFNWATQFNGKPLFIEMVLMLRQNFPISHPCWLLYTAKFYAINFFFACGRQKTEICKVCVKSFWFHRQNFLFIQNTVWK